MVKSLFPLLMRRTLWYSYGLETLASRVLKFMRLRDISMTTVIERFSLFLGILLLLYASIWLVGYPLSIIIFLVLFYRFITKTT